MVSSYGGYMGSAQKTSGQHFKVLILGGGTGGISVAARLVKQIGHGQIGVLDASEEHYYQPMWTLVGGGVFAKEKSRRLMKSLIPAGVHWVRDSVFSVQPKANSVTTQSGAVLTYDILVVATGLQLDWQKIKGLDGQVGKNGICSIYSYEGAEITYKMINDFKGGTALFIMPPVPIKCAGAPQKIMYMADEIFRKNGIRDKAKIVFTTAGKVIFGVPDFARALSEVAKRKGIDVRFAYKLVEVKAKEKIAIFEVSEDKLVEGKTEVQVSTMEVPFDFLHVVPSMSAHAYVRESGLAFTEGPQTGWLKVDQNSLQHKEYANVFGIGDVTGVPNSKTGAAIRKQAPVVIENILSFLNNQKSQASYDGYSSCPLITGFGKVVLAEFGYDGKLMPSFPFDQTKERWSMWFLKTTLLPKMYWNGMLKGRM